MKLKRLIIFLIIPLSLTGCAKNSKSALEFKAEIESIVHNYSQLGSTFYTQITLVVTKFVESGEFPNQDINDDLRGIMDSLVSDYTIVKTELDGLKEFDDELKLIKITKEYFKACHESNLGAQKIIGLFNSNAGNDEISEFLYNEFFVLLKRQKELEGKRRAVISQFDEKYEL